MSGAEKGNAAFLVQVLNRLGLNTDDPGVATLFARLSQIAGYTDTLETGQANIKAKTDLIGAAADAAGTATLFARLAQLAGYTDTIEGVLGTNADAAATDASIWAMLKSLNSNPTGNLIDITSLTPFTRDVAGAAGTGAYQTILNIQGKGFLESFFARQGAANAGFALRITIDGVVKVLLVTPNATQYIGVVSNGDVFPSATTGSNVIRNPTDTLFTAVPSANIAAGGFKVYPVTDGSNGISFLGDAKIYFTSSLLLEISCVNAQVYNYHYKGAYK